MLRDISESAFSFSNESAYCIMSSSSPFLSTAIFAIISSAVWIKYKTKSTTAASNGIGGNHDTMVEREFIDYTSDDLVDTVVVDCSHPTAPQLTHHLKKPKQR